MHEVLKLLIQLLPVVSRNQEVPLAVEKEAFLVTHPDLVEKFGNDLLHVLIQVVDSGVDLYICYGCLSVVDKLLYYILMVSCWYIKPLPAESEMKFEFENMIIGQAIPSNFILHIEKCFMEAANSGFLIGFPVENICVVMTDGASHVVVMT
ncbi:unnamed protein product [Lactuca saligna]|uniref:Translation elongation factor EFG/EF2 domain-containing protein n=1 Tax=Lactuca saligna TaxID=75948 RepID=A0AA35YRG1_LACSI|nr:unnamed protein product [Lactuca saligna]